MDKDKDKDMVKVKVKVKDKDMLSEEQMIQFNNWYERYQKKVGREVAEKAWEKLKPEEVDKCFEVVDAFVQCNPDAQYRPHPSTYLNQKRFNDQLVATKHYNPEIGF